MRKFGNTGGSESNMRIKVAVGYLLVAVAAVFAVWYIYMRIAPLAVREDATQGAAYRKVLVTGTTISSLYEASYRANIYLQDPSVDNLEAYDRAIDTVYGHIDSLCRLQIPSRADRHSGGDYRAAEVEKIEPDRSGRHDEPSSGKRGASSRQPVAGA